MDTINKLIELFRDFPGIGPRQARRFVYFLLTQTDAWRKLLAHNIEALKETVERCQSCFRYYPKGAKETSECPICRDQHRDRTKLLIVSRDVDYENIEKSHSYDGVYFILGGNIPILEKNPESRIRSSELSKRVDERGKEGLKEIILALSLTPEGENTEQFLKRHLNDLKEKYQLKISELGRGLSTGLELEYSDSETIKNALKNRN